MDKVRFFRHSMMATDCDACGGRVDTQSGGACGGCRRILCSTHLYGSWFARLWADISGRTRCVRCRAGGAAQA